VNFEGHDVLSNEDLRSGIEIEIEINLLVHAHADVNTVNVISRLYFRI
jgi:hypothetical protein